jgi:hypothetical protein
MSIPVTTAPSTYQINARVDELFAEHGFAETDEDGNIVRAKMKVVDRIADVLVTEALAANADERLVKAMSKTVLYETVFSDGPTLEDPDDVERTVAEYAATYVWSMTTASCEGRVQQKLGDSAGNTDLMLCRRKIADKPSIYVTRNDQMIVDDFVLPASVKIVKAADKTRRDMELVVRRRPSLRARVDRELASMAIKTSLALGVTPPAPAPAPALESSK